MSRVGGEKKTNQFNEDYNPLAKKQSSVGVSGKKHLSEKKKEDLS